MFKRGILTLIVSLILVVPAYAQTIGVANMQIVGAKCEPALAAKKLLDSRLGAEKTTLETQAKDLQKRSADFQAQAATMSQTARQSKQQELQKLARAFDEKRNAFAIKVQASENEMRQALATIIMAASKDLANKKKLDVIFDSGLGMVLFAGDNLEITDDLLKAVNTTWKAQGSKFK